ncbi:MAG TPA: hypothetical protein PK138_01725 [Candidatus Paceibacterota bacterium]|nr:hypothetical protein [Candidatus Paceibacterota bacterium]
MPTMLMKEFRIMQQNGDSTVAVYANAREAIKAFDTDDNPVTQLVRTRVDIQVGIPDDTIFVKFRTKIAGNGAELAGCKAAPSNFEVKDGTEVIFEAFPADGFNFVGWFIGEDTSGTPESTSKIASIIINSTLGVSQDAIITALFAPV